jgi:primosomal protein N' (replication factor Y)
VRYGITQDFEQFYTHELAVRKRTHFPPFCFLLKLTCIYKSEAAAVKNARIVANDLTSTYGAAITILGPTPAFYERVSDTYRWQIVVKSTRRQALVAALARVPNNGHWQTELDPVSLL